MDDLASLAWSGLARPPQPQPQRPLASLAANPPPQQPQQPLQTPKNSASAAFSRATAAAASLNTNNNNNNTVSNNAAASRNTFTTTTTTTNNYNSNSNINSNSNNNNKDAFDGLLAGAGLSSRTPSARNAPLATLAQSSTPTQMQKTSPHQPKNATSSSQSSPLNNAANQSGAWAFDVGLLDSKGPLFAAPQQNNTNNSASNINDLFSTSSNANNDSVAAQDDPFGIFSQPKAFSAPVSAVASPPVSAPPKQNDDWAAFSDSKTNTSIAPVSALKSCDHLSSQSPSTKNSTTTGLFTSAPSQSSPLKENAASTTKNPKHEISFDQNLARMIDIGFDTESAREALLSSNNHFETAVEMLLHGKVPSSALSNRSDTTKIQERLKTLGISGRNAEKAEKLISAASSMGMSFLNKAKTMVKDSSKKLTEIANKNLNANRQYQDDYYDDSARYSRYDDDHDGTAARNTSDHFQRASSSFSNIPSQSSARLQPPPRPTRSSPLIQASSQQLSHSESLKEQGNVLFKQGQYGDADRLYTQAIEALPKGHWDLLPLYNNRAASRLKTGQYKECIDDCSYVESICGEELEKQYIDVSADKMSQFRETLAKALLRCASAWENLEKWESALRDYRKAQELVPSTKGVAEGLRRCQKALNPATTSNLEMQQTQNSSATNGNGVNELSGLVFDPLASAPTSSAAASKPVVQTVADVDSSSRVAALRAQDQAQEREDLEKLRAKDVVDAKLLAWKNKKETNLRALLSSLDTILWADFKADWKPVQLSELITPQQVKIRYMKAIAKLHPDKLSCLTLTAEQKLLANGIFSALNDAWDVFKAQNNLK